VVFRVSEETRFPPKSVIEPALNATDLLGAITPQRHSLALVPLV
jgi:hypothetical protein